ncbi:MAG: mannose-1-phosphate guanylyltransferase/mannose-6-phosphate isomerase [Gammaproteobacteria bacterium]|nr:mannose-1-phosphate guanylyltransferase/mannose-6-phosphate isomerase [Gammaproteobacteria bacterium]
MTIIRPIILSGGAGTRLWPASVSMYPKQLLPLVSGESTMLQDTVTRLDGVDNVADEVLVICNENHRFLVAEQLREIDRSARVLLEPEGRNTAPAVALGAFLEIETGGEAVLLVMPADHVIPDIAAFRAALEIGLGPARDGKLVTFGIVPTKPETGYGYIRAIPQGAAAVPVESFFEKPDIDTAKRYVDSGEYFWNSGMFLFRADAYLDALEQFAPAIHECCLKSIEQRQTDEYFVRPGAADFLQSPSDSIDYAIMEKTDKAMMVPLNADWSDVGSWAALHEVRQQDESGNTIDGDVVTYDCHDSLIQAENLLLTAVGLEDVVIVQTRNAVLVADKSRSQDVKHIVDNLKSQDREEVKLHRQVFRPWGSYDSLENQEGFQVKRLIVNPGAVLSLQKHAQRAEHWIVVRGKAQITRNDEVFDLAVNESTYIAIGDVHRIANPFDEPVHIIEVQCGDYLGEDDIVRLEDNYGREGTTT